MARLIRGETTMGRRVEPAVSGAHREAAAILLRAEREALGIRRAAEEDARALLEDAERRVSEATRAASVAARLRQLEEIERYRSRAREDLLRLAIAVARRVIGAELEAHPEQLESTLDEALRCAGLAERVELHVGSDDLEAARELGPPGLPASALEVVEDPSLSRGDCRVLLPGGSVDGRVETRLEAIRLALGGSA